MCLQCSTARCAPGGAVGRHVVAKAAGPAAPVSRIAGRQALLRYGLQLCYN